MRTNKNLSVALGVLFATCSAVVLASSARAEEGSGALSLDQAVREGLAGSPTVKKFESARDQADWESSIGLSELLPHVSFEAQHAFSAQYETVPVTLGPVTAAVPIVSPRSSLGVEADWIVFNGLANIRKYQAGLALFHASVEESSRQSFEARKRIELAYFRALAAKRFEDVATENLKTLQESMSQVRFRLESGVATQYDVLRMEVRLSDAQTELERTQDEVVIERKRLAQAMGLAEDSRPLQGQLPAPELSGKIQSLSSPDPSQRQDFRAAELRSEAADRQASAAAGALVPAVGFSGQYEHYENTDYPGEAYGGFRDAWSVGVYARWNILDGGASIARSGAEKARAVRVEREYQEAVLSLPSDFELWRRRYTNSAHRYSSTTQDVTRSLESRRISELSFQQGRKTVTDLLEAETDLFRARAGVVQSQLDAEEALVELELTLGKEM